MGLTESERRRLEDLAAHLEIDDPRLAHALSHRRVRVTSSGRRTRLPRRMISILALVAAVVGCSLVAASIPVQQPALFAVGIVLATSLPTVVVIAWLRRRRPPRIRRPIP